PAVLSTSGCTPHDSHRAFGGCAKKRPVVHTRRRFCGFLRESLKKKKKLYQQKHKSARYGSKTVFVGHIRLYGRTGVFSRKPKTTIEMNLGIISRLTAHATGFLVPRFYPLRDHKKRAPERPFRLRQPSNALSISESASSPTKSVNSWRNATMADTILYGVRSAIPFA